MSDLTVYQSADPSTSETVTLALSDWLLVEDLCTYARGHFTTEDVEAEGALLRALDRITCAIGQVTPQTPVYLAPSSREVH